MSEVRIVRLTLPAETTFNGKDQFALVPITSIVAIFPAVIAGVGAKLSLINGDIYTKETPVEIARGMGAVIYMGEL